MRAVKTQLSGTSRERDTADRGRGWIGKLRSTTAQPAERTARLITTIAAIIALTVLAPPAAADTLVSNHGESNTSPTDAMKLSVNQFAQSFTTGPNATGYQLESISLQFATGRRYETDPVYVSVWPDNGNNRPASSGQIAQLAINHYGEGPMAGSNKYKVISRTMLGGERLASVRLNSNTRYWVHIWAGEQATTAQLHKTTATREDKKPGWSIGNSRLVAPEGGTAADYVTYPDALKIKVEGRVRGLSDLVIQPRTTATEGVDETADFEVHLRPASTATVTVDYATEDQTAFAPADFEATAGTLTFQPGDTVKTVSVPIVDDTVDNESDEVFNLELSNASGATISLTTGVATIVDPGVLAISITDESGSEDEGKIDFVISLNRRSTNTVTVRATTSASGTASQGTDYLFVSRTISFAPGETEKTFSVQIIDDTVNDGGETFSVFLDNATGAIIADNRGIGTIHNHEDLEASFHNVPQDHDGSNAFTFNVDFTLDVSIAPTAMRDHAFTVTNGDVTGAARVNGRSDRWLITVDPDGDDAVTITLAGDRGCGTQGAICSDEDNPVQLSNSPSATVAVVAGTPLTASFSNMPDEHTGADFTFDLAFTDELAAGWETIKAAFRVSGGSINRVSRKTKPLPQNFSQRPSLEGQGPASRHRFADDHAAGDRAMQLLGRDLHG